MYLLWVFTDNNLHHFDLCFSLPQDTLDDTEALLITALIWDILVTFVYQNQAFKKICTS